MTFSSGSSGNATADRRYDMAQQLRARGDRAAAVEVMQQALELVPTWPEGRFVLAEMLIDAGQPNEAINALRAYLLLDPTDSMGANPRLVALNAADHVQDITPAYVERLFDQYAPRFDQALVEGLQYSAPQQIRLAIDELFPQRHFQRCLDLGCGTGLMGAAIRDKVARLDGIDLSAGMLAEAARKNIYDTLTKASLIDALAQQPNCFDLILAADVLVYVGDLNAAMKAAAQALVDGGVVVFTLQAHGSADYSLGPDQRFSHKVAYVESVAASARLSVVRLVPASFRRERNIDVPGLLVVVTKRG